MNKHLAQLMNGFVFALVLCMTVMVWGADEPVKKNEPVKQVDTTVGVEGQYLFPWSGERVFAKPVNDRAVFLTRIAEIRPVEDTDDGKAKVMYDVRYLADMPGEYNLKDYLQDAFGDPVPGLPDMKVTVGELLPETHQGDLEQLEALGIPDLGGYRTALYVIGVLWLIPIIYLLFKKFYKPRPAPPAPVVPPPTLAEQLRPIVVKAQSGDLPPEELARLERLLLACWKERLNINEPSMLEEIQMLKANPDAGAILRAVETWLHAPPGTQVDESEINTLLEPYAKMQAVSELSVSGDEQSESDTGKLTAGGVA